MKTSDEAYTIMIFRGATTNPLRMRLRKVTMQRALVTAAVLIVVQLGIMAHYVVQTSQVSELNALRTEIVETRGQTRTFSSTIDDMKQRMLVMQELNRKLQTMFGLEPDSVEGIEVNGQGGEEFPYENAAYGEPGQSLDPSNLEDQAVTNKDTSQASLVVNIEQGLVWLDRQASREQQILDNLSETAGERVGRWAATPSIWPVKGHITSKFGPRISPFTGKKAFHSGLDIGSPRGREVKAPASGKVVVAAYDTRMGNFIRINHGYGIETTYGHLSKVLVKYGHQVQRGDVIGLVGSTGKFSTGPHLHYQVAINDKVVNPVQYILD
ncbi:M23 family metallopeptidase [Candidatus Nitronereus thalassa]|uniref:M23 family metallopeptidase n=1 Tax=Candidatus Nitronereus thalassa TaxID=3020898 RepID=A0ABU3K6N6_9BACT|nr:M23 family metallopeptidase [Candidatus Nitronereus thalassa]MDT7042032.1 M23 family metallopeptidase [Candidatus Nitronereus thalassa]